MSTFNIQALFRLTIWYRHRNKLKTSKSGPLTALDLVRVTCIILRVLGLFLVALDSAFFRLPSHVTVYHMRFLVEDAFEKLPFEEHSRTRYHRMKLCVHGPSKPIAMEHVESNKVFHCCFRAFWWFMPACITLLFPYCCRIPVWRRGSQNHPWDATSIWTRWRLCSQVRI